MRMQLLLLSLVGFLAACSENPDQHKDSTGQAGEGDVVLEESASTGRETSGPEAGQPVQGPVKKPAAKDADASTGESKGTSQAGQANESAEPPQATASAKADAGDADTADAKDIYERYCTACHEKGMAGAPKISNTAEWQKRLDERGMGKLVQHSVEGYRAMPAKGTCMDCTEGELRATIEWMLDKAGVQQ